ncbi:thioredoxin domain-containing protein [Aurantibacter crassamenti]|uniref:thioredoxin domain-containing protein n=1 Tax=Aurantibacter crassamenti TaxID=1837375 RepID=UPI0019394B0C|nr:thioredoxin domain-containing protein [Aurantibacter crassamenti]MBM1107721.1 thioredoxin domain-containing protein [Aurantibacter crassamenti]
MNILISRKKVSLALPCLFLFVFATCQEKKSDTNSGEQHQYTNALIDETSPYLLQHAHNPVNWQSWSTNALEDAKKENKLVLVSIGYSSCHWCHVMEDETFEDEEVAKIMNENFINIKVDREERPDVDQVYMTAVQLINGNGGWPLNVITLPNGKPLYGGTYHTKEQWMQVLTKISGLYKDDPEKAAEYADMVASGIAEVNLIQPATDFKLLTKETLKSSVDKWKLNWDSDFGGDLGSQKFMIPVNLEFLLDYAELSDDIETKNHVEKTLDKILLGGIYDHIAGGFFRYSTDNKWKVPHFEKMLYDNAQAIELYSKAYKVFKKPAYKDAVLQTISFVQREMKNDQGGYHAAIDADSEGEEGKFYVWKLDELKSVLDTDFQLFASYYNINNSSVWEDGNYVLHKVVNDDEFLETNKLSETELQTAKLNWNKKLMQARNKRVRPRSDDKIITSWNALLIKGLIKSYEAFGEKDHLAMAESILDFIKAKSYSNANLVHTYKEGSQRKEGFLEDYSFMIEALLNLYSATMKTEYLELAQELNTSANNKYSDATTGMYKYNEGEELIAKIIKTDDGVLPSPNAVMAHNLFKLGHIVYDTEMMKESKQMLSAMVPLITESATSYSKWNSLLLNTAYPYFEIAVVGKNAEPLLHELQATDITNVLLVGSTSKSNLPLFEGRFSNDDTVIYVCQNTTCKLPVSTVEEALQQLANF